jgi:hypothetical protein
MNERLGYTHYIGHDGTTWIYSLYRSIMNDLDILTILIMNERPGFAHYIGHE